MTGLGIPLWQLSIYELFNVISLSFGLLSEMSMVMFSLQDGVKDDLQQHEHRI